MKKRKTRKANFIKAASSQLKIQEVSLTQKEIFVLKSFSALCGGSTLCGGSGVGQAPELPQKVGARWAAPHHVCHAPEAYSLDSRGAQVRGKAPELPQSADLARETSEKFEIRNSKFETNLKSQKSKKQTRSLDSRLRGDDSSAVHLPSAPEFLQQQDYFKLHTLFIREALFGKTEKILTNTNKIEEANEERVEEVRGILEENLEEFKGGEGEDREIKGDDTGELREFKGYGEGEFGEFKGKDGGRELGEIGKKTDWIIEGRMERIGGGDFGVPVDRYIGKSVNRYDGIRVKGGIRQIVRQGVSLTSYFLIFLAVLGLGFTYFPVIKAEVGYAWKNFQFSTPKQFFQNLTGQVFNFQEDPSDLKNPQDDVNVNSKNQDPKITKSGQGENEGILRRNEVASQDDLRLQKLPETSQINFVSDISIAIPKIDAYAEITPNVNPANEQEYLPVLRKGVAHSLGTAMPGEDGNVYLFAHSAGDLLEMARMNAVFYLISKLEPGDKIYVKFGDRKFEYIVYDKKEVDPSEIGYINNRKDNGKMMTLQTCTPPGTDWRRLLVFAKILE